jgi:hypothetical protein
VETPNWIEDQNPSNLPKPPAMALKMLWDFDSKLVVMPSRNRPVVGERPHYLLCRRAQYSAGLGKEAVMENKHPDTWACMQHSLVPIAPIRSRSGDNLWTVENVGLLIRELKARDTWAVSGGPDGNGDAVADAVEAMEASQEARERATMRDNFHHMARDAYRSILARTGSRNKRASDYHGHARSK